MVCYCLEFFGIVYFEVNWSVWMPRNRFDLFQSFLFPVSLWWWFVFMSVVCPLEFLTLI
jgi:hypothetical protein